MKTNMRIFALVMAVMLCLSGCTIGSDTSWVCEYQGERMPAGIYLAYQVQFLDEAAMQVYQNTQSSGTEYPTKFSDLLKAELDEITVEEWVKVHALRATKSAYIVESECERLGVEIPAETLASIEMQTEELWSSRGSSLESKLGLSKASWMQFQQIEAKRSLLFDALYGIGGEREISESELKGIFATEYAKAELIRVDKEEGLEAERKAMAEDYFRRLESGEAIEDIDYEHRLAMAETEEAKAAVTKRESGQLASIYHQYDIDYYLAGQVEAIFDAYIDAPVMTETEDYYFVIVRLDILENAEDFARYRSVLVMNEAFDKFEDEIVAEMAALDIVVNETAVSKFKVSKLESL